ncbi:MAG: hypothetical protein M3Y57_17515 [Acidobacteriota bacterium]|nr:hypothetical protein [Acidobacteriota bacterium]
MNIILHIVLCSVLILVTIGVAIYRHWLENHCDHYIHLHNDTHDASVVDAQSAMCRRFEMIDKLRTGLIVAVVAYIIAICAIAGYNAWNTSGV